MAYTNVATVSEQALAQCDSEPIHTPNAIQPNGALLVVHADRWDIVRASENAHAFLGIPISKLMAMRLPELLGHQAAVKTSMDRLSHLRLADVQKRVEVKLTGVFESLICEVHWIDHQHLVVEVELASSPHDTFVHWKANLECLERITYAADQCDGLQFVLEGAAISIKTMTDYDRVMIYQMDEAGHGRIVAEAKEPHLEEFVGMHFPASDIPKQARALYMTNRVRVLTDVGYQPIQILCRDPIPDNAAGYVIVPSTEHVAGPRRVSPKHGCHCDDGHIHRYRKPIVGFGRLPSLSTQTHRCSPSKFVRRTRARYLVRYPIGAAT